MEKIITLKHLAKELNISTSTVSRALQNHPRIGAQTRLAVQKLAKERNFIPNPKALFLRIRRSYIVGVIVPSLCEDFFSKSINGIENVASMCGYTILFGQSHDSMQKEQRIIETMVKQRIDGLIISLSKESGKYQHLSTLEKYDIPVVYFDRVPTSKDINKVFCDLSKGTEQMVSKLFAMGKKRIALLNGPDEISASKERLKGYMNGIKKRRIKVDMQMVEKTDLTVAGTQRAVSSLLKIKRRPDAIISFNDYVHHDAVKFALNEGVEINKDIIFASYANISSNKHAAYPPALSVDQYPFRQGQASMELLFDIINKSRTSKAKETSYKQVEIAVKVVASGVS